jgi:hypothetical protein
MNAFDLYRLPLTPQENACCRMMRSETSSSYHLFALAGIEKPRVIKSLCFACIPLLLDENKLLMLSLMPNLRFFCRSSCSARTFAVSDAVPSFLMFPAVSLAPLLKWANAGSRLLTEDSAVAAWLLMPFFFLFFPVPAVGFRECENP